MPKDIETMCDEVAEAIENVADEQISNRSYDSEYDMRSSDTKPRAILKNKLVELVNTILLVGDYRNE